MEALFIIAFCLGGAAFIINKLRPKKLVVAGKLQSANEIRQEIKAKTIQPQEHYYHHAVLATKKEPEQLFTVKFRNQYNGFERWEIPVREIKIHDGMFKEIITTNGSVYWTNCTDFLHREGGPAKYGQGFEEWWHYGTKHRIDGPANSVGENYKEYWQNGQLHRADGPAKIGSSEGPVYYQNGKLHRVDGPAFCRGGYPYYYINGEQQHLPPFWVQGIPTPQEAGITCGERSDKVWHRMVVPPMYITREHIYGPEFRRFERRRIRIVTPATEQVIAKMQRDKLDRINEINLEYLIPQDPIIRITSPNDPPPLFKKLDGKVLFRILPPLKGFDPYFTTTVHKIDMLKKPPCPICEFEKEQQKDSRILLSKGIYGQSHRHKDGTIRYTNYKDQLHRSSGPAVVKLDGTQEWWLCGKRHRTDGPAIIYPFNDFLYGRRRETGEYWIDGKRLPDGVTIDKDSNGTIRWRLNDALHREGGAAVIRTDGTKEYWLHGTLQRELRGKRPYNSVGLPTQESTECGASSLSSSSSG